MPIMGPEVYMSLNQITHTPLSVGHDREAVDLLLADMTEADQFKARMREDLRVVFACPFICEAITTLADRLFNYEALNPMSSEVIRTIIDPILSQSVHAEGLRERATC
jgi:hypothetical protein